MPDFKRSNELRRARRRARRVKLIALLGGKCVKCGAVNNLEFDHIDRKKKTFDIANTVDTTEQRLMAELKNCQLLCHDCHKAKTREAWDFGGEPARHGTIWMYKRYKCRCDDCRKAMSQYYYGAVSKNKNS